MAGPGTCQSGKKAVDSSGEGLSTEKHASWRQRRLTKGMSQPKEVILGQTEKAKHPTQSHQGRPQKSRCQTCRPVLFLQSSLPLFFSLSPTRSLWVKVPSLGQASPHPPVRSQVREVSWKKEDQKRQMRRLGSKNHSHNSVTQNLSRTPWLTSVLTTNIQPFLYRFYSSFSCVPPMWVKIEHMVITHDHGRRW